MAIFQLTPNVLVQDELIDPATVKVTSWAHVRGAPSADVAHIGHVVNWFRGDEASNTLQVITADTIRTAASFALNLRSGPPEFRGLSARPSRTTNPRLIACVAENESDIIPAGFLASRPLTRTVLALKSFNVSRSLPLVFDILEAGAESAYQDGFLVLTNTDICLMPNFYRSIQALLSRGIDCLIVNRRTVGQLPTYGSDHGVAMTEVGYRHGGFDCFVFPVAWVQHFVRSEACVGAGGVMQSLLFNLVALAKKMLIMRDAHLTYHFGNDESWTDSKLHDYIEFNLDQARSVLSRLCQEERNHALLSAFCRAHQEFAQPEPNPDLPGTVLSTDLASEELWFPSGYWSVVRSEDQVRELKAELVRKEQVIRQLDRAARERADELVKKEQVIRELDQVVRARSGSINRRRRAFAKRILEFLGTKSNPVG